MNEDEFDPTMIQSSDEEQMPVKRKRDEEKSKSKLPDPLELLKIYKEEPRPKPVSEKKKVKVDYSAAVITKSAVLSKSLMDPIEQYDYFASQSTALLDNWKAAPELPDPTAAPDRSKFIKKVNMRRKGPEDIAARLERELARREKAKSGWKRWKNDEELQMKQKYDS